MSAPIRLSDERGQYESAILARYAEARQRLNRGVPRLVSVSVAAPPPATVNVTYGSMVNLVAGPSWKVVVGLCALKHEVSVNDILGKNQRRNVSAARQEAMALCYTHCNKSLPQIGQLFTRDHTTALHAVRRYHGKPVKAINSLRALEPIPVEPIDFLTAPSWRFIVRLVAMKRRVPLHKVLEIGCRARRETRDIIAKHCDCTPAAAGVLLSNWGVQ